MNAREIIYTISKYIKDEIQLKNFNYIELGVCEGFTFNYLAPLFNLAYAIDKKDYYISIKHNQNLQWFQMTTNKFLTEILPNEKIKFSVVFIDAWHSFNQVMKDFKGIVPFIIDNGFIFLHDTHPSNNKEMDLMTCNDAYKAAEYIRFNLNSQFEIVTLPTHYGLSIIRKANKTLLWLEE